jgi:hypothetical protein
VWAFLPFPRPACSICGSLACAPCRHFLS